MHCVGVVVAVVVGSVVASVLTSRLSLRTAGACGMVLDDDDVWVLAVVE